jgi:hypothetical protein
MNCGGFLALGKQHRISLEKYKELEKYTARLGLHLT